MTNVNATLMVVYETPSTRCIGLQQHVQGRHQKRKKRKNLLTNPERGECDICNLNLRLQPPSKGY